MTAKNKQRQKQIPCGNDKKKGKSKVEATPIRLIFLTGGGWYAMLKRQV
jgi:hypothetical protein